MRKAAGLGVAWLTAGWLVGCTTALPAPGDAAPERAAAHDRTAAPELAAANVGAAAALTLVADAGGVLPVDPRSTGSVAVIAFVVPGDVGAGGDFAHELRAIYGDVAWHRMDATTAAVDAAAALDAAARADAAILALFIPPAAPAPANDTGAAVRAFYRRLAAVAPRAIVVDFADPHSAAALQPATLLLTWQPPHTAAQRAAARAIAGVAAIDGRTPVDLPNAPSGTGLARPRLAFELHPAVPESVGMSSAALDVLDAIIESAILAGATPGAAIAVGRRGRLVKLRAYGTLDWRDGFGAVTDSSLYDLASLTKVIATTTLVMMLVDDGLLDLDAPLSRYLHEWHDDGVRAGITVRHLLLHTSGLPPYATLHAELRGSAAYVRRIGSTPLQYEPGTQTVYSDFGPILLAAIIERVGGAPLEQLFEGRLAAPLGLRETLFNPASGRRLVRAGAGDQHGAEAGDAAPLLNRTAPTEVDTLFRREHVHGHVHDENAFAMGGVSGHAGLFGSARDLARFAQMLLDGGFFEGRRYVRRATLLNFTRRQSEASSRALGWDTPGGTSSAGDYFSARSFGHTGFTGTSIWIDPERELFVVLLANRVNPTRANQQHIALRRAVADAVQRAVIDAPLVRRPGS